MKSIHDNLLKRIHQALLEKRDDEYRVGAIAFFKEPVNPLGVRSADVNKLVAECWKEVENWEKQSIHQLCEHLFNTGTFEEGSVACKLATRIGKKASAPEDLDILEEWIDKHITNWAHCDDLCTHAVGDLFTTYPETAERALEWAESPNRWLRRAAAVSFVFPGKKGLHHELVFTIADKLLTDDDDLVQKGYGWMLKSTSLSAPDTVFRFVCERRTTMPRMALRYAIEKLPKAMRREAMKK